MSQRGLYLSRCRFNWVSAFSILILLALVRLEGTNRILVEEFELRGSADIIITASDLTRLLWRDVGTEGRFAVYYTDSGMARDSFRALVRGSCLLEESNLFNIRWSLSRWNGGYERGFAYSGYGLSQARDAITSSLDSFLFSFEVVTDPDSSEVYVDGEYVGMSPLVLEDMPLGWYELRARKGAGLEASDSIYLQADSTRKELVLHAYYQDTFSYVRLLTPPECELYLDGVRQTPSGVDVYRFEPGAREVVLVSRQYGTRRVELELVPGDTLSISFFNQRQP